MKIDPRLAEMHECLEDVLEWLRTGMVDGVGFDQQQIEEAIERALKGKA